MGAGGRKHPTERDLDERIEDLLRQWEEDAGVVGHTVYIRDLRETLNKWKRDQLMHRDIKGLLCK